MIQSCARNWVTIRPSISLIVQHNTDPVSRQPQKSKFAILHPPYYTLFCITFVFNFSRALQWSQDKLKTMLMPIHIFFLVTGGGGGGGARSVMGDAQMANERLREQK